MPDDKPFGWRPFSEEQREEYRKTGWKDEDIDQFEAKNVYKPIDTAVLAYQISIATLVAAAKRHGADFIHDVRSELIASSEKGAASANIEDRVEAQIVASFVEESDWDALIARASGGSSG
ncbi:MAG: hypothetical protein ACOY7L_18220 [Pseudomonadota bacterium]